MNQQSMELSDELKELLSVLSRDVEHIESTISKLDELRCLVIKRDEKGLAGLLEEIKNQAREYSANEQRRGRLRKEIADGLGCPAEKLTLGLLMKHIDGPARVIVAETRNKLRGLVERLRREYVLTATLLSDCARINSLLLKAVFRRRPDFTGICYDSAGGCVKGNDAAFMNLQL